MLAFSYPSPEKAEANTATTNRLMRNDMKRAIAAEGKHKLGSRQTTRSPRRENTNSGHGKRRDRRGGKTQTRVTTNDAIAAKGKHKLGLRETTRSLRREDTNSGHGKRRDRRGGKTQTRVTANDAIAAKGKHKLGSWETTRSPQGENTNSGHGERRDRCGGKTQTRVTANDAAQVTGNDMQRLVIVITNEQYKSTYGKRDIHIDLRGVYVTELTELRILRTTIEVKLKIASWWLVLKPN